MGRPLYSAAYATPAVRVEPEPIYPTYHRWSERQFDPDSDEFFESEDAVYEAFITPEEQASLVAASMPVLDSPTDDEDSGSSGPPSRDEHVGSHVMEPPVLPADAIAVISRDAEGSRATSPTFVRPPFVDHLPHRAALPTVVYQGDRPRTPPLQPTRQAGFSTPSPAPTVSTPHVWVTPRSLYGSPSPAPATTPRVYTWGRPGANSGSPSPRDGPFTNGGARRSLSHISAQPAAIRLADPVV